MTARKRIDLSRGARRPRPTQRLLRGDFVREKNDNSIRIGIVIHLMDGDERLVIVSFPPSRVGHAFHADDLVRV